jgi:zinc protease
VIVGDFNQDQLVNLAKKYYGNWKRGTYTLNVPLDPPQTAEKVVNVPWKSRTLPILVVGYHGPAFSDTQIDMPAMDLLSQVVFSETSELFRKLVIEEQLVEFVQGGAQDHRDPTLFQIFTRIKDPRNIDVVRDAIYGALEKVKTDPVSADRLANIKSHMRYQFAMGLDNPDAIARGLGSYIQLTGDPESVNRVYALYERVTPEDIMMVAKKYFTTNNRTVVLLQQEETK